MGDGAVEYDPSLDPELPREAPELGLKRTASHDVQRGIGKGTAHPGEGPEERTLVLHRNQGGDVEEARRSREKRRRTLSRGETIQVDADRENRRLGAGPRERGESGRARRHPARARKRPRRENAIQPASPAAVSDLGERNQLASEERDDGRRRREHGPPGRRRSPARRPRRRGGRRTTRGHARGESRRWPS